MTENAWAISKDYLISEENYIFVRKLFHKLLFCIISIHGWSINVFSLLACDISSTYKYPSYKNVCSKTMMLGKNILERKIKNKIQIPHILLLFIAYEWRWISANVFLRINIMLILRVLACIDIYIFRYTFINLRIWNLYQIKRYLFLPVHK